MIETVKLLSRTETVFVLHQTLGFSYCWHHILMLWTTKSKADYSVLNSEIRLFPYCKHKTAPLYLPSDIKRFIKEMRERFPDLKVTRMTSALYDVDTTPSTGFMKGLSYKSRKAKLALPVV